MKIAEIVLKIPDWLVWVALRLVLLCRRLRCGYAFRRIPLTQGRFAIVDPADYATLSRYKWRLCKTKGKNVLYAERSIRRPDGRYSRLLMHRQIMENTNSNLRYMSRACPERSRGERRTTNLVIDHINGCGLDNRRANLRLATVAQNAWNAKKRNPRSGYKGVWYAKDKDRWRAAIVCNGKRKHLGYFKTKREAAKAYDEAATTLHGEFAVLNFISK